MRLEADQPGLIQVATRLEPGTRVGAKEPGADGGNGERERGSQSPAD